MPLSTRNGSIFTTNAVVKGGLRLAVALPSLLLLQAALVISAHAFQQSDTDAASLLQQGRGYIQGLGKYDPQRAAALFQKASDQGSIEAMAWLGNAYIHGRGVPTDLAKGSGLINTSAEHGDPVGLRFYGLMYQEGVAVAQDLPRAKEFYEKAAAKGDVPSFGRLGMMYLMGKGVPQDRAKGTDLLKAGSAAGDAWAKVELGRVYMTGLSSRDRALAVTEYTEAAQAGNRIAAFRLGRIYQLGYAGQKPDMEKAAHFYSLSAARGYPYGQLGLARLSMTGNGVQKDNVYAYALLMLAAEQGLTQAELYEHQLSQSMSASQIAQASILAQKFKARASQDEQSPPDSQE